MLKFVERQLFHLMRGVFRLARVAHAIALDGLCHDDGRLTLMMNSRVICGIDFLRIMATSIEAHDLIVAKVFDEFQRFGIFTEELSACIAATFCLVVLILPVDRFVHPLLQ